MHSPSAVRHLHLVLASLVACGAASACAVAPAVTRDGARARTAVAAPAPIEVPRIQRPGGETAAWWFVSGAAQAARHGAMAGRARNVILFVGDGMSLPTVAAARILAGQRAGASGEEHRLAWEEFPATALVRTYNTDAQTPDSSGTMTAMTTGAKTRYGVLGIGQQPLVGDCAGALAHPLLTLWELAAASGLATGVVTTTSVTDATPAATFSHSASRRWENDSDLPPEARAAGCIDIARQLVESPHGGLDVLMGGGRSQFLPSGSSDPEYPGIRGLRGDGRDLVQAWQRRRPDGVYAWNAQQFEAAPADAPLLALFEPDDMHHEHDRGDDRAGEPSLAQMTRDAITRLQHLDARGGDAGFVLLVEAGRIDHAHHAGNAYRALDDTIALDDAVRAAVEMTSADDTLILVTADHAHTMNSLGHPTRGNPILGKVRNVGSEALAKDADGLPYTTLNYADGPGHVAGGRPDLIAVDTTHPDYRQEALIPRRSESHSGDDVGLWALGPGSAAVRGSIEQNAVFHVMLQATPRLREALCAKGACNADGVPVVLPAPADFRVR